MLKDFTVYTAICDGCGENLLDETEYSGADLDFIDNELKEADWEELVTEEKGEIVVKHYCSACYDKLTHKVKN